MENNKNKVMPSAIARIKGSEDYRSIHGIVTFYQQKAGVLVKAEVYGLPHSGFYALHIHSGDSCTGNEDDPFSDAGVHYNPDDTPHPDHAGDLPPLLGNNGYAHMEVFTNRFNVREILGKVIIIHKNPDDFTTQPSGNSGEKIACGKILE